MRSLVSVSSGFSVIIFMLGSEALGASPRLPLGIAVLCSSEPFHPYFYRSARLPVGRWLLCWCLACRSLACVLSSGGVCLWLILVFGCSLVLGLRLVPSRVLMCGPEVCRLRGPVVGHWVSISAFDCSAVLLAVPAPWSALCCSLVFFAVSQTQSSCHLSVAV